MAVHKTQKECCSRLLTAKIHMYSLIVLKKMPEKGSCSGRTPLVKPLQLKLKAYTSITLLIASFQSYRGGIIFPLMPLLGQRPLTRAIRESRSWVSLSSCPQAWPILFASASRSWHQGFPDSTPFFFPWEFHVMPDAGLQRV